MHGGPRLGPVTSVFPEKRLATWQVLARTGVSVKTLGQERTGGEEPGCTHAPAGEEAAGA